MKVYIVCEGCYSEYHIDSVFTDRNQAELRVATLNASRCDPVLEEWETDEIHLEGDEIERFRGRFDVDYGDERIMFDDENGNRHVIYFKSGTVIVNEISED